MPASNQEIIENIAALEGRITKLEAELLKFTKRKKMRTQSEKSSSALVREAFLDAWERKFGHKYPGWGAIENTMLIRWLTSVSLEDALKYATIYPNWKHLHTTRAGHPFKLLVYNYVELDAHMKRYPHLISSIIDARARENVEISSQVKDREVLVHADQHEKRANPQIADSHQDEISLPPLERVSGTCPESD